MDTLVAIDLPIVYVYAIIAPLNSVGSESEGHLSFARHPAKMDKYLAEYRYNIKWIDRLMWPINQNFLNPSWKPKNPILRFLYNWQIWYGCTWIVVYLYLIVAHGKMAGLNMVSAQIWCVMCVMQMEAKIINGEVQKKKLMKLLKWCEELYTMDYGEEYKQVVLGLFEKTNRIITFCIR